MQFLEWDTELFDGESRAWPAKSSVKPLQNCTEYYFCFPDSLNGTTRQWIPEMVCRSPLADPGGTPKTVPFHFIQTIPLVNCVYPCRVRIPPLCTPFTAMAAAACVDEADVMAHEQRPAFSPS